MKKQLLALATITIVALTACEKDPAPQVSTSKVATKADLLGKWDYNSDKILFTVDGEAFIDTTITYKSGESIVEYLASDKIVYSGTNLSENDTVRYSVENGKLTFFFSEKGEGDPDQIYNGTIDGKNLTIVSTQEISEDGVTIKTVSTGKLTRK